MLGEQSYAAIARWLKPRQVTNAYSGRTIASALEEGAAIMHESVRSGRPVAIGKLGASELRACREAEALHLGKATSISGSILRELHLNAGVFPPTTETLVHFAELYRGTASEVDILAVWFLEGEREFVERHVPQARFIRLIPLEPYASANKPWSAYLEGKRVVAIGPFSRSVREQYAKRGAVWRSRPEVLPEFQLRTIQAPFSDCLVKSPHNDWFAALEHLKSELAKEPFDVALIGCSAFSLPLAVEAKRLGGIGIHLGGATQLLFGILGARWEGSDCLRQFVNEAWVRPSGDERPAGFRRIEGGGYW